MSLHESTSPSHLLLRIPSKPFGHVLKVNTTGVMHWCQVCLLVFNAPMVSSALVIGKIRAPELTAYFTTSSKNSGTHPKGVGVASTSCVAKTSHPRDSRL